MSKKAHLVVKCIYWYFYEPERNRMGRAERTKASMIANAVLVVCESIAMVICFRKFGTEIAFHFTNDANLFSLAASLLYLIFMLRKSKNDREIPEWVSGLRFLASCCLFLTFTIVAVYLAPSHANGDGPMIWFFGPDSRFTHTICPAVSTVSVLFLEKEGKIGIKWTGMAVALLAVYGFILEGLNIARLCSGPYEFLKFYDIPLRMTFFWFTVMFSLQFMIAVILRIFRNSRVSDERKAFECHT
jgi:hypothetical protein